MSSQSSEPRVSGAELGGTGVVYASAYSRDVLVLSQSRRGARSSVLNAPQNSVENLLPLSGSFSFAPGLLLMYNRGIVDEAGSATPLPSFSPPTAGPSFTTILVLVSSVGILVPSPSR